MGHPDQLVTVERLVRADGAAAGSSVLVVRNPAGISLEILLDRAMDIGWADALGFSLAWKSPRGNVSSSRHGEDGWVDTFPGGLLTTCGLRSTGMPSTVDGEYFGLHGRISSVPAEQVTHAVVVGPGGDPLIEISGRVVEGDLGSTPLVLKRRIVLSTVRPEIRIDDVIVNEGYVATGHMYRHHFNLGFPAVQGGTVVESSAEPYALRDAGEVPVLPWTLRGEADLKTEELGEVVVYCRPASDTVTTRATAPDGRGIEIENSSGAWPYLVLWRDPRPGINVLGVEPSTSEDGGRASAEVAGDVRWLEPGQSVAYSSTVRAYR